MEPELEVRPEVDPLKEDQWPLSAAIVFAATGSVEAVAATWPALDRFDHVDVAHNSGTLRIVHLVLSGVQPDEIEPARQKIWEMLRAGELNATGIAPGQRLPVDIPVAEWRYLSPYDQEAGNCAVGVPREVGMNSDSESADPLPQPMIVSYANVHIPKAEIMSALADGNAIHHPGSNLHISRTTAADAKLFKPGGGQSEHFRRAGRLNGKAGQVHFSISLSKCHV